MSAPVYQAATATCPICGEVCCERDLVYVDEREAGLLDVEPGDMVCRGCAGEDAP